MRMIARVVGLALVLGMSACAAVLAATWTASFEGGTLSLSADEIGWKVSNTVCILEGNAHIKDTNKVAKTVLDAYADTVTVTLFSEPAGQRGSVELIKSIEFVGPVRICQTSQKAMIDEKTGEQSTVTATADVRADDARYDGATHMACLEGNVKMTMTDPSSPFEGPVVVTGEAAAVNLDPNPGPDDFRYKVSKARLEATPKAKED